MCTGVNVCVYVSAGRLGGMSEPVHPATESNTSRRIHCASKGARENKALTGCEHACRHLRHLHLMMSEQSGTFIAIYPGLHHSCSSCLIVP
jgi:hypothetical protein